MPGARVQGLAEAYAMFDGLPEAAREQMGVELAIIGRDFLALQQLRVPKDTGKLEAGLGVQLLLNQLRVRIGLNGLKKGQGDLFYGRILEFGRKAQTVLAKRRVSVTGKARLARQRGRANDLVQYYAKKIGAIAPRPFVLVSDPDIDAIAAQRLADFWGQVLDKAGAGA